MNSLPDPIAGKGEANILPALKFPEFGEIAQLQTANNQLALQAAKLAADQKAKEAALVLARAKAEKEAADKAKEDRNKQDVAMYSLLAQKDLFQLPVAQEYFLEKKAAIQAKIQAHMNGGGTLYDDAMLPLRNELAAYNADYLAEHENAKALVAKGEAYDKNPEGLEQYSKADDYGRNYVPHIEKKKKGEQSQFFLTSLSEKVGVATPEEVAAYEKDMFGEAAYKKDMSGKPIGKTADNDAVYLKTERYEPRPIEQTTEDVNKNLRYSNDKPQKRLYNFYYNQAKGLGLVDADDNIKPEFFQKREDITRKKGGVDEVVHQVHKTVIHNTGGGGGYRTSWGGGGLDILNSKGNVVGEVKFDGRGNKTIKYTTPVVEEEVKYNGENVLNEWGQPIKRRIKGGIKTQENILAVARGDLNTSSVVPGNQLLANSVWHVSTEGLAPYQDLDKIGTFKVNEIVYYNVDESGKPIASPFPFTYEGYSEPFVVLEKEVGEGKAKQKETFFINVGRGAPAYIDGAPLALPPNDVMAMYKEYLTTRNDNRDAPQTPPADAPQTPPADVPKTPYAVVPPTEWENLKAVLEGKVPQTPVEKKRPIGITGTPTEPKNKF